MKLEITPIAALLISYSYFRALWHRVKKEGVEELFGLNCSKGGLNIILAN